MNLRVLFLLLALVLVWSGHAVDRPASASTSIDGSHPAVHVAAEVEGKASPCGQAPLAAEETVVDWVGLVPSADDASAPSLLKAWPGRHTTRAWTAPYLDGPQRPPRATHLLA